MKINAGKASIDSNGHTHFLIDDEVSELLEKTWSEAEKKKPNYKQIG